MFTLKECQEQITDLKAHITAMSLSVSNLSEEVNTKMDDTIINRLNSMDSRIKDIAWTIEIIQSHITKVEYKG